MKFIFMVLAGSLSIFSAVGQDLPKQIPVSKDSSAEESASERQDLSEVTVSATRFAENKKYLAQQVFTISRRMIRSANQPSTADLLSQTGQVLVQKSQLGGGSPIIRGFEANKVLLSVDGVRMNNAIYRGGHLQNVITLNDESLESIEILFGPSSVMYGSDALGGVISFFTKNPEFTDKKSLTGSATARYATVYEGLHLHAEARAGSPRFASYSSFSYSKFGNLRQGRKKYDDFPHWGDDSINVETIDGRDTIVSNPHPDRQTPTGYSQYDAVQKFLFFTGGVRNTVNVQFSTSTDIPRYDRLTEVNSSGIPKSAEWYYGPQQRWLIAW